ncbi:MAG: FAD-binding protein, partial [Acidimicrobiaceae bacterium]
MSQYSPTTEHELQQIVRHATANQKRIKAVGSGHSFTAIALAEEILVDLSNYDQVVAINTINNT